MAGHGSRCHATARVVRLLSCRLVVPSREAVKLAAPPVTAALDFRWCPWEETRWVNGKGATYAGSLPPPPRLRRQGAALMEKKDFLLHTLSGSACFHRGLPWGWITRRWSSGSTPLPVKWDEGTEEVEWEAVPTSSPLLGHGATDNREGVCPPWTKSTAGPPLHHSGALATRDLVPSPPQRHALHSDSSCTRV